MILRYRRKDGTQVEFELGDRPITIGRSPEADLVILDEKASRLHCGIRLWDEDFVLKDLHSRNGTYVNDRRVELTRLNVGDRIRIGACVFTFDQESGAHGGQTLLTEVREEMEKGKGYSTLLREIVEDASLPVAEAVVDDSAGAQEEVVEEVEPGPHPAAEAADDEPARPRTVRLKVKTADHEAGNGAAAKAPPQPVILESRESTPPPELPAPRRTGGTFKVRVPPKTAAAPKDKAPTTTEEPAKTDGPKKTVQFRLKVPPKSGSGK